MTVCVAVKVHDCIVFAADSAVSLQSSNGQGRLSIDNVWAHGAKVFNLHRELPLVAMTAGIASFGSASVSNLAKDLRIELTKGLDKDNYSIGLVAKLASDFFSIHYNNLAVKPANPHLFEFWIGGYGVQLESGEIWKVEIRDGVVNPPMRLAEPQVDRQLIWGGQIEAISRVILGHSALLPEFLKGHGVSDQVIMDAQKAFLTPLVDPTMPVQDAINLADFLVDISKKYSTFLPGANVVGGDTDIATVTKHEGFRWIRRKYYYPRTLNPKETGHAE